MNPFPVASQPSLELESTCPPIPRVLIMSSLSRTWPLIKVSSSLCRRHQPVSIVYITLSYWGVLPSVRAPQRPFETWLFFSQLFLLFSVFAVHVISQLIRVTPKLHASYCIKFFFTSRHGMGEDGMGWHGMAEEWHGMAEDGRERHGMAWNDIVYKL